MISYQELTIRFFLALLVGAIIGVEREAAGKEAGIRTSMLVSGSSAVFSIISLTLPYIVSSQFPQILPQVLANNNYLGVIANIVVGVGFLGAGIIIKTEQRIHGLTTAAMIWSSSAVGTLIGIGMTGFGIMVGLTLSALLYVLRRIGFIDSIRPAESS